MYSFATWIGRLDSGYLVSTRFGLDRAIGFHVFKLPIHLSKITRISLESSGASLGPRAFADQISDQDIRVAPWIG